jgi:hypothetical protein
MTSENQPHILAAAAIFLGTSLLLLIGLEMSGAAAHTWLDEVTIVAMLFFLGSGVMSPPCASRKRGSCPRRSPSSAS